MLSLKSCIWETPKHVLLQTVEDPDEMSHNAAIYLGQHCLLWKKRSSDKKYNIFL